MKTKQKFKKQMIQKLKTKITLVAYNDESIHLVTLPAD